MKTQDTRLFREVFHASPVGIVVENLDGQPLFVNPAFCAFLGFSEEELHGKHCVDFSPPEDAEKDWALFKELRAGSRDHYELEKRYFRRDGSLVWGHLSISLLNGRPSPLIIAMVQDITEKKAAEHSLLELNSELRAKAALLQSREELLRIFVKNAPVGVAMFDRDMRYLQVSNRWCENHSLDISKVLGRSHYELNPDLPDRWKDMHRRGLEGETLRSEEDRWDRESGAKWFRWEVRPWWNLDTKPGGILLFAEDITVRKQMEEALSDMTRKLVEAQELERARIARELHDDINQRLALLAIGLGQIQVNGPDLPPEILESIHKLEQDTRQITTDVQALSHDLHSPNLKYLGLAAGMAGWCDEFGERHRIRINFESDGLPTALPQEISLCLFRVLQEALNNAAKHGGVNRVEVQLHEQPREIELIIRDSGRGFDVEAAKCGRGLGLTSMQERVRLVGGTIGIDSEPSGGTTIQVRVPILA